MRALTKWLADNFRSPQQIVGGEIAELMDVMEKESRRTIVRCGDCGSLNVRVHLPDGSVGYFGNREATS